MDMIRVWLIAIMLVEAVPALAVEPAATARITKVLQDVYPRKTQAALAREIGPNEVGKFKELRHEFAPKPAGVHVTALWRNLTRQPLNNVTVTMRFRQANLPDVQSASLSIQSVPRGQIASAFQVIGEAYTRGGPVTAWKIEVAADGKLLDSFRSFLWKDPS